MTSLRADFVMAAFAGCTAVGIAFKAVRVWRRRKETAGAKAGKFQLLYFLCNYAYMIGFMFQGPYVYQRYIDCGLAQKQISIVMSTYNIVSSCWGMFVGYLTNVCGHRLMIVVSAVLLGMHAVCRCIGGFGMFVAASVLMGIATASNKVVFEDWLMLAMSSREIPESLHAVIQENSALLKLVLTLLITPVSSMVTERFGSSGAFFVSAIMFFVGAVIIMLFLPNVKKNDVKKKRIGYGQALKMISKSVWQSKELMCLLAGDFFYSVYLLLYTPRWVGIHQVEKKEKLPLSQISSANTMALMIGAQFCGAFINRFSYKFTLFANFVIYVISLYCIILFYDDKNLVFLFYMISSICDGGSGTFLRILKSRIYPKDVRSYILGFLRVPTSLAVSFILIILNDASILTIIKVSSFFLTLTVVMTFLLFVMEKRSTN